MYFVDEKTDDDDDDDDYDDTVTGSRVARPSLYRVISSDVTAYSR